MTTVTTKAMAKVAAVATGLAMATSMLSFAPFAQAAALSDAQVSSILSLLSSFGADASTIANVRASLTGGTPSTTTTTTTTGGTTACSFSKALTMGSTGMEVTCLQKALIAGGFTIPAGATGYFGSQTRSAVAAWQLSKNIAPAVGYFGSISRAAFNLGGGSTTTTTGTTTTTTTTVTGNGLKISLSPTSPNGTVLVQGQGIGDLADFVFANPTAAPIAVTALSFKRTGVSNDSTMTNVYLYNAGVRLTDSAGISSSAFSFTNSAGLFTVPAGSTYTVSVRSDIALATSGQQIGVSLVSATSNGTLDSSVSFPIVSGLQTISAANLATVTFGATVTPTATTIAAQNDYPIWQNNVAVSTNPVKLTSMKFVNLGSADSAAIVNLRLYVDGAMVGAAVPVMGADRTVTFDLSAAPVTLSTASHVVKVLANITNTAAGRTVLLSVQRSSDGMFVDSQLGQPVTPVNNGGTAFSAQSTGLITIQSASAGVSVSLNAASPNQNVAAGATSVKFASFDFLASGENVKVSDLYLVASSSLSSGALAGVGGLNNGKVMINGVQVGSTKDIVQGNASTGAAQATDFSFGSSLILPAGVTTTVDIYADAADTAGTNLANLATTIVRLVPGSSNGQGVSSLASANVPATNAVAATSITISTSTLSASASTSYGAQSMVAGSNVAKIGSFALSTGATEGVTVNTIAISMPLAASASITNLTLKDHATGAILGSVITTPVGLGASVTIGANNNSFPVNLVIAASSSKTIDVYANILSGANAGPMIMYVDTGTTGVGSVTGQSASQTTLVTLQQITVGAGTLAVTTGAGDPVSNNILAGASSVLVGEFNFSAANSAYTVQNLAILVPFAQANDVSAVTLSYKDVNGATVTATQALVNLGSGNATATFSGLTMYVPANDSANVDVYIATPTVASGATAGAGVKVTLDAGATVGTFRAVNSAGVSITAPTASSVAVPATGTFYIRKSIPTIATTPLVTGAVPATGSPLYKFSVTADPAGAIEWTQFTFNIATTSATITNIYLTDDATGTSLLDGFASTSSAVATTTLLYNTSAAKFAQVAAGATKIYDLYGTVTGYTTGSSVTISLASDGVTLANAAAITNIGAKMVWSDRSAASHTISTLDWTNGFLIKNFTSSAVTYSK